MTTKLISATGLQLLRRFDKKSESARAQLLDEVIPLLLFLSHFKQFTDTDWSRFLCVISG